MLDDGSGLGRRKQRQRTTMNPHATRVRTGTYGPAVAIIQSSPMPTRPKLAWRMIASSTAKRSHEAMNMTLTNGTRYL